MQIMLTRPAHQAKPLQKQLSALGHSVRVLPTLTIQPIPCKLTLPNLGKPYYLVVTSANAVPSIATYLNSTKHDIRLICLGPATAACCAAAGGNVAITAPPPYGTQALLESGLLQQLPRNSQLEICTGVGCSLPLIKALERTFNPLRVYESYRRSCPDTRLSDALTSEERDSTELIICTSADGLNHLHRMTPNHWQTWLRSTPLLVISPNMKQLATKKQHQTILEAGSATDECITKAVIAHAKKTDTQAQLAENSRQ